MAKLNKHVQAATAENSNWRINFPSFWGITELHPIAPPMSLLLKPSQAGKCESVSLKDPSDPSASLHSWMVQNHKISKQKMKDYADTKRHAKPSDLIPGDHVQPKTNQLKPLTSSCRRRAAKCKSHRILRNSSHFRRIPKHVPIPEEEEDEEFLNPEPVPLA